MGLGPGLLLSGNYFILRNTRVPAILGEPSYLSHPAMERLLNNSAAVELEATAYFRGIVKWFALGVPKITGFSVDSLRGVVKAIINSETPLNPLLTGIYMDEKKLDGTVCGNGYTAAVPFPLSNGVHAFTCVAGNSNGNFAKSKSFSYTVDRPAETLIYNIENQPVGCLARLRIAVLDCYRSPVRDGTPVIKNDQVVTYTENGIALFYVPVTDTAGSVYISCDNAIAHPVIPAGSSAIPPFQGFVSSLDSNFNVPLCLITIGDTAYTPDRNGFFSITAADTSISITSAFRAEGFQDDTEKLNRSKLNLIKLKPSARGILIGKKIVIDPEFGGAEFGGISPDGIRACDITRKIAYEAAGLLRQYGARVSLARQEDHTINITERIFTSEEIVSDMYIVIRSDSVKTPPYVSYFPGSSLGRIVAENMARQWYKNSGDSAAVLQEPAFVMQQTQCPAITLSLSPLNSPAIYHKNSSKVAQTILYGLIAFYSENFKSGKRISSAQRGRNAISD